MAETYTPIYTYTAPSAQSSVTLNSFSGYTDLIFVLSVRGSSTSQYQTLQLRFNSDTNSNYSFTGMLGSGTTAASERAANQTSCRAARLSTGYNSFTGFDTTVIHLKNYANTNTYKCFVSRGNHTNEYYGVSEYTSTWRSTSAITSVTFLQDGAYDFVTGSTFTVYGLAAA